MSNEQQTTREEQINMFLQNLSKLDDGERARFKRNAGNTLAESHQVTLLFYQKVAPYGILPWQEDIYFLLTTLYPFDKRQREIDRSPKNTEEAEQEETETAVFPKKFTLGTSFRQVRSDQNQTGSDRRFARLLDADREQLPFQLRQAIMRLTADWVAIDWAQLTKDILNWENSSRYVQRNWARDYVATPPKQS